MKRLLLAIGLAGTIAAPNLYAAFDGTVDVVKSGPGTLGGEFTATAAGIGTWQTFCLEDNEFIDLSKATYDYNANSGAVLGGGVANGATAVDSHTGLPMDPISLGTAYLFSQFSTGGIVIGNTAAANDLQQAFWLFEDEITVGDLINAANPYVASAVGMFGAAVKDNANGAYGVYVLNLYNGPYSKSVQAPDGTWYNVNQDILAIPEPTTVIAGLLLLLPLGASTLRIIRKNRVA